MMKSKFAVLMILFLAFSSYAFAQETDNPLELQWLSFEEMQEAQLSEKRKVLVDIYADWCFWCKKMDENSLSQKQIADCLSENFYLVRFNSEDDERIVFKGETYLQKDYDYSNSDKSREVNSLAIEWLGIDFVYPSLVILDENLNKISVFDGYKTAQELDPILNYFSSNSYINIKWSSYIRDFKSTIKH